MAKQLQTIIFLVRHGQTDHSYALDQQKDAQRRLTPQGRTQSESVGRYLRDFQPVKIYTSPLFRCQETAEIIQQSVRAKEGIEEDRRLVEVYTPAPHLEAESRGGGFLNFVVKNHAGQQVVAVTHQYIIGYAIAEFFHRPYGEIDCEFADVYRLVFASEILVEAIRLQPAKQK